MNTPDLYGFALMGAHPAFGRHSNAASKTSSDRIADEPSTVAPQEAADQSSLSSKPKDIAPRFAKAGDVGMADSSLKCQEGARHPARRTEAPFSQARPRKPRHSQADPFRGRFGPTWHLLFRTFIPLSEFNRGG